MTRTKRQKWELNRRLPRVFEPPIAEVVRGAEFLRGTWHAGVFGNQHPITLELGCGRGTYTVELARRHPARSFVGVDVKGHRFATGARAAAEEGLANVAFLRGKVEFIERYFAPAEVAEIWLTFSDPQPRDGKGTKRITSPYFLERYARVLAPRGLVHVKSDSPLLYRRTREGALAAGHEVLAASDDVHGRFVRECEPELAELLAIRTTYEERWVAAGRRIHYLRIRLAAPPSPAASEPDALDDEPRALR